MARELALRSGREAGDRFVPCRDVGWGTQCSLFIAVCTAVGVVISNTALRRSSAPARDGLRSLRLTGRLALMRVTRGS